MPEPTSGPTVDQSIKTQIEVFASTCDWTASRIEPLSGDVSARRYYRIHDRERTAIVASYPSDMWPAAERFRHTGNILAEAGLRVPQVLALDRRELLVLVEDLGPSTCYDLIDDCGEHVHRWLEIAAAIIPSILQLDLNSETDLLPPLDAEILDDELRGSVVALEEWTDDRCSVDWTSISDDLSGIRLRIREALEPQPLRPTHRDFMLRNLVPTADDELAIIDHQDLRLAPLGYDFASLVNDSVFPSPAVVSDLKKKCLPELSDNEYHWLAAQRTLKSAGTYARAWSAGNGAHEGLIVPTLRRWSGHLEALEGSGGMPAGIAEDLRSAWLKELVR